MSDKKLKGKISISRFTSNTKPFRGINIELDDESSGIRIVDIELTMEEYANAISGLGHIECEFEMTSAPHLVGSAREVCTLKVPLPEDHSYYSSEEILKYLEPWSINGWEPRIEDFRNRHNISRGNVSVSILFTRYLPKPQADK